MPPRPDRSRVPRWRAHVAAVELVGAAVLAHASADGGLPGPEMVLWITLVALGLTQAVRHHLLRPTAAALLAGTAQVGVHLLLTAGPAGTGHGTAHGSGDLASHATGHAAGHSLADPSWVSDDMLLAHGVAAALTLLALVWQEQVVADLRQLLRGPDAHRVPLPELPAWLPGEAPAARGSRWLLTAAPRRGPPLTGLATG